MRKLAVCAVVLGLLGGGCSWLGFGDDSSTTAAASEAAPPVETAAEPDPAPAPTKATAAKTTAKTTAKAAKAAKAVKGAKSEAQIQAELDQMGKKLASQSARTLLPNKANKDVKQVGGQWVASYIEVRPEEVRTQLRPGSSGQYVGSIRYAEHFMECRGATRQEALKAPCHEVRSRNLNELIRYDGKQWQD